MAFLGDPRDKKSIGARGQMESPNEIDYLPALPPRDIRVASLMIKMVLKVLMSQPALCVQELCRQTRVGSVLISSAALRAATSG